MVSPNGSETLSNRECEVSPPLKRHLFLRAMDVMLDCHLEDSALYKDYVDSTTGVSIIAKKVNMNTNHNALWSQLNDIQVSEASLMYIPEGILGNEVYPETMRLSISNVDGSYGSYDLVTYDSDSLDDVKIYDKIASEPRRTDWTEVSRKGADRIGQVLSKAGEIAKQVKPIDR